MERIQTPPVVVQHPNALKGQYMRNTRDQTVWKVTDVGREGLTVYQVACYGGDTFGPETTLTWRLAKKIYAVMVHVAEIDAKEN